MVFWAGILVAALFARLAVKIGFYETWAMLFNIVLSIYLGVHLKPALIDIVPSASDTPYGSALTIFGIALGAFLILHGISFVFFTGQFSVTLPKILNIIGAGLLGFIAGLLVWSFVTVLVFITPISQNKYIKQINLSSQIQQTSMPIVCWWCNLVNKIVSSHADGAATKQELDELIVKSTEKKGRGAAIEPNEPNEPDTLPEPNNTPKKVKTPAPA